MLVWLKLKHITFSKKYYSFLHFGVHKGRIYAICYRTIIHDWHVQSVPFLLTEVGKFIVRLTVVLWKFLIRGDELVIGHPLEYYEIIVILLLSARLLGRNYWNYECLQLYGNNNLPSPEYCQVLITAYSIMCDQNKTIQYWNSNL